MLIILFPYKFTEFQYLRLGLDFFEKNLETKFEVHDLSKVVNPSWEKAFLLKRHKKTFIFNSLAHWEGHLNNLATLFLLRHRF